MAGASWHWHAPVETGARHRQIAQLLAAQEAEDLVPPAFGLEESRRLVELDQEIAVPGQAKEPGFLDRPVDRCALRRELLAPLPFNQLVVAVEGLVAYRVPALVTPKVEVSGGFHRLPDGDAGRVVPGLGGAHERIIRDVQDGTH